MSIRIAVIGGGSAGLFSAIIAAREGACVTIFEHNEKVGRKILSTGNGKCNYTNLNQKAEYYRSDDPTFPWKVISAFPSDDAISFFRKLGILPHDKNGYVYPNSEQASAILDVLRFEAERLRICLRTNCHVTNVIAKKGLFQVTATENQKSVPETFDRIILTTGSKAAPKLGNDGSGYRLAKAFGHTISPVVPALVQLRCKETSFYKAVSGVRVQSTISLDIDHIKTAEDTGELQLTDYGISGIPVFQISRYAAKALAQNAIVEAHIQFLPGHSAKETKQLLQEKKCQFPHRYAEDVLTGILNKKLAGALLKTCQIPLNKEICKITDAEFDRLSKTITDFRTVITATNSFEQGQICAGGVCTREINPQTMESKLQKGLFFAGEIVDVDGICGGYNLQWAWSSGYLAGKGASHD